MERNKTAVKKTYTVSYHYDYEGETTYSYKDILAKDFNDAAKILKKEYTYLSPVVTGIRINENPEASYEDRLATVQLPNKLWSHLTSFLLMTTNYRKGEAEAWDKLAKETEEDGTPSFKHAASNASFWREMEVYMSDVRKAVDERG